MLVKKKNCYGYLLVIFFGFFMELQRILSLGVLCDNKQKISIEEYRQMKIDSYVFTVFEKQKNTWEQKMVQNGYGKVYGNALSHILLDMKCFPVKNMKRISFENSWMNGRAYGGNREHEGTDIMDNNNKRGTLPVISVSDGVVEKIGWLELGGYRIGIRSENGVYFYYAHLHNYANGIKEGVNVKAGDVLGTMGDTGYGEEGTTGQFPVHLHFGIYVDLEGKEYSVNPYYILKYLSD